MSSTLSNFALKCTWVNFLSFSYYKIIKKEEIHIREMKMEYKTNNKRCRACHINQVDDHLQWTGKIAIQLLVLSKAESWSLHKMKAMRSLFCGRFKHLFIMLILHICIDISKYKIEKWNLPILIQLKVVWKTKHKIKIITLFFFLDK